MEKSTRKKTLIHTLIILSIILLAAISLQTSFAIDRPVDNSTAGGGIREGLNIAFDGDTLLLAEGNYTGTNNTNITINKSITIQGNGPTEKVIIDSRGLCRIFNLSNDINVKFINITFINGNSSELSLYWGSYAGGGAICNSANNTTMNVINCIFTNNTSLRTNYDGTGGAIYNRGFTSIYSCTFNNNTAYNGGAIYGSNLSISNSTFDNNNAIYYNGSTSISTGLGGAIGGNFAVYDSNFINNTAGLMGGATYGYQNVTNCIFINNTASRDGGAISAANGNISHSIFINNTAYSYGGAIYGGMAEVIYNCTFINNTAIYSSGGAIANIRSASNCTFINNSAYSTGGAIQYCRVIFNCNFINNSAISPYGSGSGGAIYVDSSGNISNCTFINNTASINGGAIYLRMYNYTVENNNFINNTANNNGGAIFIFYYENYSILKDNNFTNNKANGYGGGIYNEGNVTLVGNNMTDNTAGILGNAIYNNGTMGVLNLTYLENATITINVTTGTIVILNATLTDDMGNPITGQNITFYVNGTLIGNIESNEGYVSLTYEVNGSHGDKFPVYGDYDGVGDFEIIKNQGLLQINLIETNSTIVVSGGRVGQQATLSGVAIDENGDFLANVQLTVTINGVSYNVTTDGSGAWNLNYIPTANGNLNVAVSWVGNSTHTSFTNSTVFNVIKSNSNSTIVVPSGKVAQRSTIRGVAIDDNGRPIANTQITVTVNGRNYTVTTDSVGAWSLNYTPTISGRLNVVVSWTGNASHTAFTNSTIFSVATGDNPSNVSVKPNIKLIKRTNSRVVRHKNIVYMKWLTFKNIGASGSQIVSGKVIYKNFKYKLWKVYNKNIKYRYGNNKLKFKVSLKSGNIFKLKLKVYRPIKKRTTR